MACMSIQYHMNRMWLEHGTYDMYNIWTHLNNLTSSSVHHLSVRCLAWAANIQQVFSWKWSVPSAGLHEALEQLMERMQLGEEVTADFGKRCKLMPNSSSIYGFLDEPPFRTNHQAESGSFGSWNNLFHIISIYDHICPYISMCSPGFTMFPI